jgi:hypothetical protein
MYSENSSIFGAPSADETQVCAYMLARDHGEYTEHDIRRVIVPTYYALCRPVGVDPVLPLAQMIHETGNLTSFWAARPQRNPAGIGVNGRKQHHEPPDKTNWAFNTQRGMWEVGISFPSWQNDSIPAHIGRLLAYFLPPDVENAVQREATQRGLRYRPLPAPMRGSAPTLKQLGKVHNPTGQGWASPGSDYGAKIAAIANRIRETRA